MNKPNLWALSFVLVTLSLGACASAAAAERGVDFARDIRPLLNGKCAMCHGGVKRAGNLSFLSREGALAQGKSGGVAVKPGDAENSQLLRRITSKNEDERMPPPDHGPGLSSSEIELLRRWINQGAPWKQHWAYEKPMAAPLPPVKARTWIKRDLDRFVLARLESERLSPTPEADKPTWLRRVSFDLTGLPPTAQESKAFLADSSPQAHEKVTDRLLGSPRFGERWASAWLDLARYADTMGYERDPNRSAWPWRDWVVRAFNDDLPYNEFLTKQLAGDLLPNPTLADRLATAFHRNTQGNTECGSDDEEFRTLAVIDRIATTWEGLMGTSFRCVQCHSHPYDPFPHEDFYRFAALFNTTRDNDSPEDFPHLKVPEQLDQWTRAEALDRELRHRRLAIHSEGLALAEKTPWRPMRAALAVSDGNATVQSLEHQGVPEVHITGVVTLNALYTLEFPAPLPQLAALRIEALPFDLAKAAASSELGFVLSHLRLAVVGGGRTNEVTLAAAYDDDPEAFYPAEATLADDLPGWSAYPRINRPRRVVFIPETPVPLPTNSLIRLTLQTKAQSTGITSQMLRRSRFAISDNNAWPELFRKQTGDRQTLAELRRERDAMKSVAVPVLIEQPLSHRRETRLFNRGNFLDPGLMVEPGVPQVLGAANVRNRLELAQWMTSPDNPLTARATVNRVWEQLFGRGLVESAEDFGSAGSAPSHPALLDWLSIKFATSMGWSQKKLMREIVLSATYRQASMVTPKMLGRDPNNLLLSRGPRARLSAEMVRDQALAVSGLLSTKIGGPPVMPLQPEGIWRTVYNGGKWVTSPGEDSHRRSLYTFIRRTSGYPSFLTFDAPSREVCAVRRIVTSTPLQALVTLNDPVYVEAAKALAERMANAGAKLRPQLEYGCRVVSGRSPSQKTLSILSALHARALATYSYDPALAKSLAGSPNQAALTLVANALLNLDDVLTK